MPDIELYEDEDGGEFLPGPEYPCPECGEYYVLMITARPMPDHVASGSTEDMDAWDEANQDNISQCTACGWTSDDS